MIFTTMPQLIVLILLLFGGLMLGLGLHPGGKKWRTRFQEESANYAKFRRDADIRLRAANDRIAELERGVAAPVAARPVAATQAVPASSDRPISATEEELRAEREADRNRHLPPA